MSVEAVLNSRSLPLLLRCVVLLVLASCAAPLTVFDPAADPTQLRSRAQRDLQSPATRLAAQCTLAWLCLLHATDCADLASNGAAAADDTLGLDEGAQAALLRALSLQAEADIGLRARAWLDVLQAAHLRDPALAQADTLATVGAEALARLALRDRHAVLEALAPRVALALEALAAGAPLQRWRRTQALGALLAACPGGRGGGQPLVPELAVRMAVRPLSRRLFTGLEALGPTPPNLPTEATASLTIDLPLDLAQRALPAALRSGNYLLASSDPGVYALSATFDCPRDGQLFVVLQSPRALRAWVNGVSWVQGVSTNSRGSSGWIEVHKGGNRIDLAVAVAGNRQTLQLALLDGRPTQPAAEPEVWPQAVQLAVAALLDPQGPERARLGATWPSAALTPMLALEVAQPANGEQGASVSVLDQVLELLPRHADARIDRIARLRDAGNPALAMTMLGELGLAPSPLQGGETTTTRSPLGLRADAAFERANTLFALGLSDEAVRAAEAAVLAQPGDCAVFERALGLGLDAADRAFLRRLLQQAPACPAQALTVAQAQAAVGNLDAARQTWGLALAEPALAIEASRKLGALCPRQECPEAELSWAPDRAETLWRQAQRAQTRRDTQETQRALGSLLAEPAVSLEARQKALLAGAVPPWQPYLRSGETLAAASDDPQLVRGAGSVYLLDQEIIVLLPGGGALRRVHQVVRVLGEQAADAVGEVRVADGADLEFARTLLPDGAIVLPAETLDKETISLRAVSAGATVEYAQVVYVAPEDPATGATRLGPFLLQATDAPVALAECIVLIPDGVTATIAPSPLLPAPFLSRQGNFAVQIFRRTALPRFRVEPRAVHAESAMPSLRVSAQATLASMTEPWNETLASFQGLQDEELERWLAVGRALPAGVVRWQKLAARLAKVVQHTHEGGQPGRPDSALANQKGDRAAVLYTLARRLGEDVCLVRVLPLGRMPAGEPPDPEEWGLEVLRLRLGGREVWYDPALEGGLLDHLRAGLRGRQGLLVGCTQAPADVHVTLPNLGQGADQRRIEVDLDWLADGRVSAHVRDRLSGSLASLVRSYLRDASETTRTELLGQLTGASFGSLTVTFEGADGAADEGPLTVRYAVSGPADPMRVHALDLGLYADQLGQSYAGLAERRTRLLFSHAVDTEMRWTIRSPGKALVRVPADIHLEHAVVQYSRSVQLSGETVVLTKTVHAAPVIVETRDYAILAAELRSLDAADLVRLER